MSEEITFDDIEFGEPIEEREPDYRDGYIRGIYRAKNIIDSKQKEIERLNNIINKGIEAINVYQNEKTLSIGYQDLKRIRGILRGNEFDLKIFEEYLQELKGVDKE